MAKSATRSPATAGRCYASVTDMVRDLLADDPDFVAEFEQGLAERQLVKALAVLRNLACLSQKELADRMGCGQPKVSKIENGVDADVRFGDVIAYLTATGHEVRIGFVPAGATPQPVRVELPKPADQPKARPTRKLSAAAY